MNHHQIEKHIEHGSTLSAAVKKDDGTLFCFCIPCKLLADIITNGITGCFEGMMFSPLQFVTIYSPDGRSYPLNLIDGRYEPYTEPCVMNLYKLGEIFVDAFLGNQKEKEGF